MEVIFKKVPETYEDALKSPFLKFIENSSLRNTIRENFFTHLTYRRFRWFQGHQEGKTFVKVDSPIRLGIHYPKNINRDIISENTSIKVAHFYYYDWFKKYERRITPDRMQSFLEPKMKQHLPFKQALSIGIKEVEMIFQNRCCVNPKQIDILREHSLYIENNLFLKEKIITYFGDKDHGFSKKLPKVTEDDLILAMKNTDSANNVEKLYIHLGVHKTGTTSLQKVLLANKDKLQESRISFIHPRRLRKSKFIKNKVYLGNDENYRDFLNTNIGNAKKLLLSEEELLGGHYDFNNGNIYTNAKEYIENLLKLFPNRKITTLFLTIREYSQYIESNYLQHMKALSKEPLTLDEYLKKFNYKDFSWLKLIEDLNKIENIESIYIWTYEDFRQNNHLVWDFLSKEIGVKLDTNIHNIPETSSLLKKAITILNSATNLKKEDFINLRKYIRMNFKTSEGYGRAEFFSHEQKELLEANYKRDLIELKKIKSSKINFKIYKRSLI